MVQSLSHLLPRPSELRLAAEGERPLSLRDLLLLNRERLLQARLKKNDLEFGAISKFENIQKLKKGGKPDRLLLDELRVGHGRLALAADPLRGRGARLERQAVVDRLVGCERILLGIGS